MSIVQHGVCADVAGRGKTIYSLQKELDMFHPSHRLLSGIPWEHGVVSSILVVEIIAVDGTTASLPYATQTPLFFNGSFEGANEFFVFIFGEIQDGFSATRSLLFKFVASGWHFFQRELQN